TSLAIILAFVGLQVRAGVDGALRYRFLLPVLVACALALPLLTQTRSGILLVLALGAVLWRLTPGRQMRWLFGAVAVALLIVAATLSNKQIWSRSDHTVEEIHQYVTAPVPPPLTSATTRIELWRNAIKMVEAHPLIGVGNHRFRIALAELQARGQTPKDLELYSHPHNDLLKMTAEGGLLGSLCWGLLLLFPLGAGIRAYGYAPGVANPAMAVVLFSIGMLLAGMVDVVLIWRPTIMFYGVAMSLLLAHVARQPAPATIAP
ncbi:MAG: O-antigen ligase family protein, partial [Pseudomonadota bacterium]|nr:O-antigen ligase family protein [Pseudomonadota bacterium]